MVKISKAISNGIIIPVVERCIRNIEEGGWQEAGIIWGALKCGRE